MNREIKFRGRIVGRNEWTYGFLICNDMISSNDGTITPFVEPETIGQFTGLKDKNGKEIYEGDILMRDGDPLCYVIRYSDNCASFFAENDSFPHESKFLVDEDLSEWEVICNIYDNKNLLED